MAAGGDIIELVHEQTYMGQVVNNVYFFEAVVAGATLQSLGDWFELNMVPAIKAIQESDVEHGGLHMRNLFDPTEMFSEPLTGQGDLALAQTNLPSFVAAQIRFEHIAMTVRPGFKRFAGMSETYLVEGLWSATLITNLATIGGMLINPATPANPNWAHVIVGRICAEPNPVAGAVPSCLKYRLPENQAEAVIGYPVTFSVYAEPTSQNTRKWYT